MIELLLSVVGVVWRFVVGWLVPPTLADLNIVHIALWTPILLGMLGGMGVVFRKLHDSQPAPTTKRRRKRRSADTSSTSAGRRRASGAPRPLTPAQVAAQQQREYRAAARALLQQTRAQEQVQRAAARELARQQAQERAAARELARQQREQHAQERAAARELARQQAQERAAARELARQAREQQAQERAAASQLAQQAREQAALERAAARELARDARAAQPTKRRRKADPLSQAFGTDPNRVYAFRYRVVELDQLITSNTDSGAINPAYDQSLQPRMRDRAASRRQIEQLARSLVPESLLWDFHQLDKGAPIIGSDLMVESGNGRALALRRARADFESQWGNYQAKLRENLAAVGLSPSDLEGVAHPVLVRERISDVDRVAFAREANAPPVLQMSTLETALIDSRRLSDDMILRLAVREDQSIDQALRAKANIGFVRDFVQTLSENEAALLMRKDGTLNQAGIWRIKAAVFARVFPGEAGKRIAETFLESLDSTTKNFENAISATLPALARAESRIASGQRGDLSLADDMSKALDMLARLKEQELPVQVYLEQASMFNRELTPLQEDLLAHFDHIGRSPKSIRAFLNAYADAVENSPDPAQVALFDDLALTKEALVQRIIDNNQPQAKAA